MAARRAALPGSKTVTEALAALSRIGLVPVVTIKSPRDAAPLAGALLDGGIGCAEITFRTPAAAEAIAGINSACRELLVGAGTVLTVEQAEQATKAGAHYVVAPGFDPAVVGWCQEHGVPVLPGAATPTEISMALTSGLSLLKFFPAEAMGGVRALQALSAPFAGVRFIPTGGITAANLPRYLALPNVAACGGSWMVKEDMIASGKFTEIARLSREARAIVGQVRGEPEVNR
jgi:2-dehydro-3-deoxyphosphogluconate aldolase/(4S)-4-hydroxy-2-oxoglutarate aldolase